MLDFLIDNIFVLFGFNKQSVSQQVRIVLRYSPILFLHAYKADFLQGLLKNRDRILAKTFNSSFRYIYDSVIIYIASIQMSLKLRIRLIHNNLILTLAFTLKSTTEDDQKQKSTTTAMTTLLQQSAFPSSVAIFQHHQHMEFTNHNSYFILELVPITVIFWT